MKVFNYMIMITGLAILFELAGLSVASNLLNYLGIDVAGSVFNPKTAGLYLAVFGSGGILIGLAVGIGVGFITKSQPENFIILPVIVGSLVFFFAPLSGIILKIFAEAPSWIAWISLLILAPLSVGFILSLVEFFRGTD